MPRCDSRGIFGCSKPLPSEWEIEAKVCSMEMEFWWKFLKLFGAAICVTGLCLVLLSDAGVGGGGDIFFSTFNICGSKPLLGDLLVIAATLFYAMSNVGESYTGEEKPEIGKVVCRAILERKNPKSVEWSAEIILVFAGYGLSFFMFYSFVPFVLKMSGATMFNLSILTSDMWAVVIRIFFYHQQVDWLYYLSFAIEVVGLVIYSKTEKDPIPAQALVDGNLDAQYQVLGEESAESTNEVIAS
ncbi:hypothetical protein TEA_002421 [Camellia sinensis var. sinensis]|uniref:Uncharacterized protein n=1 Tax=Camellia sinensis var. sinensis TaxID=542762 RepID=A0A4S4E8J4_CAMSN|nr:hypothetical protein TEA_002421 [Camellia sinensis var. sinensis]